MTNQEHRYIHPQCAKCWWDEIGLGGTPTRETDPQRTICCFCGGPTISGIIRHVQPGSFTIPYCPDMLVDPVPVLPEPPRLFR